MTIIDDLADLLKTWGDEELCQAVKECNIFDEQGDFDLESKLCKTSVQFYGGYTGRWLDVTAGYIYKEAANRFMKSTDVTLTCLECKYHEHSWDVPQNPEAEPQLLFYCNHPSVELNYEEITTEHDLDLIAEKCTFYEVG